MTKYEELQPQIIRLEEKIETHATELRALLEELAELVNELDEEEEPYYTPKGNYTGYYEIQDLANSVSEIEDEFEVD